jgi:hypothetical protein
MHRLAACGFLVLARRASFQHQDPLSGQMWNGGSTPQQGCEAVKTVLGFSGRASENPQPNQNGFSPMQDEVMESFCTRWWHIIIEGTDRPWQINIKHSQAFRGQGAHPPDRFLKHHDSR